MTAPASSRDDTLSWVEQGRAPDYYADLGLAREAPQAEVREAYRRLALRFHPDSAHCPALLAEARIRQVNAAYAVLGDPASRRLYDLNLR